MTRAEFILTARRLARPGLAFRTLPRTHPRRRVLRRYRNCVVVCVRLDGSPADLVEGSQAA